MRLLNFVLCCSMLISPNCFFAGSGFLIDKQSISKVYVCAQNKSEYKENVTISVKTDGGEIRITPTINYGYEPKTFLGDFIGNGLDQIFYCVNSGGSEAYSFYQIISLQNNCQKTIYDSSSFNNTVSATLEDCLIKIRFLNQYYCLDASNADLSGQKEVFVSAVNTVMPIYNSGLNKYQILQLQKIYIDYTANNVGYFACVIDLNMDGGKIISTGTFANFTYVAAKIRSCKII